MKFFVVKRKSNLISCHFALLHSHNFVQDKMHREFNILIFKFANLTSLQVYRGFVDRWYTFLQQQHNFSMAIMQLSTGVNKQFFVGRTISIFKIDNISTLRNKKRRLHSRSTTFQQVSIPRFNWFFLLNYCSSVSFFICNAIMCHKMLLSLLYQIHKKKKIFVSIFHLYIQNEWCLLDCEHCLKIADKNRVWC